MMTYPGEDEKYCEINKLHTKTYEELNKEKENTKQNAK